MLTPEKFAASQQASIQALMGLTGKAFEGMESLVALNLQATKAALGDAAGTSLSAFSAKDPQALFALQAEALQPSTEKAAAYVRQVQDIATAMKTEIAKVMGDATAGAQASFAELFEAATRNAPAGSENGIALWKSAVATASNAFESLQKAAQQASDVAEANYAAATTQVVKATKAKRA